MNAPYRLGILIVLGVVLASSGVVGVWMARSGRPEPRRAGRELGLDGFPLGSYRFAERSGRAITDADLADDVWVAAFVFTRCPVSCPKISAVMKGLQPQFAGRGVKLVSISVDPEYDTPDVLKRYADGLGADPDAWWFLSGKSDETVALIRGRFKLPVAKNDGADRDPAAEDVKHSPKLALVDRGNVVDGWYDSNEPDDLTDLVRRARRLGSWARPLPALNATLNGTCALLLMVGWVLIRTDRTRGHAACMISAVTVSAIFLACYLAYHFEAGSVKFRGEGGSKFLYSSILLSHTLLATFGVVPLVTLTLIRAIRKQYERHSRIARVTFPIWLYVSITGVVIYWMLYRMPISASS